MHRARTVLEHRRWIAAVVTVGVLLAAPTLTVGLQLDDHVHRVLVEHMREAGESVPWWDMFRLADGNPARMWPRIDHGSLPWWTLPELRLAFFRPLPSLTHYLDYTVWPGAVAFMHGINILLYAAVVIAVGLLYRRLVAPAWAAGLAALAFAVDDSHGPVVGWIANRHALMAVLGSTLTLWAHDRSISRKGRGSRWLGPGMFASALACGEIAIVVVPILGIYAAILDERAPRQRVWGLAPYGCIVVAWVSLYVALRYGVSGSDAYVDPLSHPRDFVVAWSQRIPAYLWGLLFHPPPDAWLAWNQRQLAWSAAGVLIAFALLAWIIAPWLRQDRHLRFWTWSSLIAITPACIVLPADRMLLVPGIFAYGFMARFAALALAPATRASPWIREALVKVLLAAWFVIHLIVAPVNFPLRGAIIPRQIDALQQAMVGSLSGADLEGRTVIVVGAPDPFLGAYLWTLRVAAGLKPPSRIRVLGAAPGPAVVRTIDRQTVEVQSAPPATSVLFAQLVRDRAHPMSAGDTVELSDVVITVLTSSPEGIPTHVRFAFDQALDSREFVWLRWQRFRLQPFEPPPVGQTTAL